MRKLTANYVFDGLEFYRNLIIVVNEEGVIVEIKHDNISERELEGVEFYNGILCPGFVNAHTHLELSFLKNKIKPVTSLKDFIEKIKQIDRTINEDKKKIAKLFDLLMYQEGISVCADIANTCLTAEIKKSSAIYYHTFVELYSVEENLANYIYNEGIKNQSCFSVKSLTPHAPYSVSFPLLELILRNVIANESIISIHFKESKYEAELFNELQNNFPLIDEYSEPSIQFIKYLPKENQCLFVHCTYITKEELSIILDLFKLPFFVICPNSNLYIEKKLPPLFLILDVQDKVCVGTDSLASNNQLSILEELKTLSSNYPSISLALLLKMATSNGAKALNVNKRFGTIKVGTSPGIILLENLDLHDFIISNETTAKRIL